MKTTSRSFSIIRTGLIGMPFMAVTLLASQAGWAAEDKPLAEKKSVIFFRGGYTEYVDEGRGFESFTDTHGTLRLSELSINKRDKGWYVGAGVEHSISSNLLGLMPGTQLLGEIGLEWKRFGSKESTVVVPSAECALLTGNVVNCPITGDITITMFTVSASPKIKFLEGSPIRPWIIPAGLDFHVISPPSDAATVLDVGVQFAGGLEFEPLPGIKVGIDGRYHYTANETNTRNNFVAVTDSVSGLPPGTLVTRSSDKDNDFWTAGAYLGFSF